MREKIESILMTLFLVALATTLVLPKRETPKIITLFFDSLAGAVNAMLGRSKSPSTVAPGGSTNRPVAV